MIAPVLRSRAEALALIGRTADAKAIIDHLVVQTETEVPTYLHPEIMRTHGRILQIASEPPREVEAAYLQAIDRAKRDGALGWKLRSAISLARYRVELGDPNTARIFLEESLQNFLEGFHTYDVKQATELLEICSAR